MELGRRLLELTATGGESDPPRRYQRIMKNKIIPFPVQPAPAKAELDEAEPQNIIVVEFDRDEYIVTASPAV